MYIVLQIITMQIKKCLYFYLGCPVGTIITMPLSGLLTKYGPDGWASTFYCFGKYLPGTEERNRVITK